MSVALGVFAFDESLHETFVGGAVALVGLRATIAVVVRFGLEVEQEDGHGGTDQGTDAA